MTIVKIVSEKMNLISKKEIEERKEFYFNEILNGKIFIYPTDTIYGIGCNALNEDSVNKIREIKQRESKPFSIIVPSKKWIKDNCIINKSTIKWLNKLPGPYTLILKIKNKEAIAKSITNTDSLGVRIPNNWFARLISKSKIPFITTSVNISGQPHIHSINELSNQIKNEVNYIIDDGKLNNPPSTIIDLTKDKEEIIKR